MINFSLSLSFAWSRKLNNTYKDYFSYDGSLWGTKHWEIQCSKMGNELVVFQLRLNPAGTDHGGIYVEFGVLRYLLIFTIYDSRHWNYEENCWHKLDKEQS